jgi:hypothetical protein
MISDCILAGDGECIGLAKRDKGCGTSKCPFYKTTQQEQKSQQYAKQRLARMGMKFKTLYKIGEV